MRLMAFPKFLGDAPAVAGSPRLLPCSSERGKSGKSHENDDRDDDGSPRDGEFFGRRTKGTDASGVIRLRNKRELTFFNFGTTEGIAHRSSRSWGTDDDSVKTNFLCSRVLQILGEIPQVPGRLSGLLEDDDTDASGGPGDFPPCSTRTRCRRFNVRDCPQKISLQHVIDGIISTEGDGVVDKLLSQAVKIRRARVHIE